MSYGLEPYRIRLRHPLSELPRCPHCGTAKPTLELRNVIYKIKSGDLWIAWLLYRCTSCTDVICFLSLVNYYDDIGQLRSFLNGRDCQSLTIMPGYGGGDLNDWPEAARTFMAQALESKSVPDGAVMLAGSAVDAMLKAKGLTDGSVYSRISKAVEDHLLTEAMGEWAHSVRLAANNPRHADLNSPHASPEQAKASLEFTRALGQFLFTLPAKIERGKAAADEARTVN